MQLVFARTSAAHHPCAVAGCRPALSQTCPNTLPLPCLHICKPWLRPAAHRLPAAEDVRAHGIAVVRGRHQHQALALGRRGREGGCLWQHMGHGPCSPLSHHHHCMRSTALDLLAGLSPWHHIPVGPGGGRARHPVGMLGCKSEQRRTGLLRKVRDFGARLLLPCFLSPWLSAHLAQPSAREVPAVARDAKKDRPASRGQ